MVGRRLREQGQLGRVRTPPESVTCSRNRSRAMRGRALSARSAAISSGGTWPSTAVAVEQCSRGGFAFGWGATRISSVSSLTKAVHPQEEGRAQALAFHSGRGQPAPRVGVYTDLARQLQGLALMEIPVLGECCGRRQLPRK
jgi:hypothetical protein